MLEHLIGKEVAVYLHYGQYEDGSPNSEDFLGTLESVEEGLITLRNVTSLLVGSNYTSDTFVINMKSPIFVRLGNYFNSLM